MVKIMEKPMKKLMIWVFSHIFGSTPNCLPLKMDGWIWDGIFSGANVAVHFRGATRKSGWTLGCLKNRASLESGGQKVSPRLAAHPKVYIYIYTVVLSILTSDILR